MSKATVATIRTLEDYRQGMSGLIKKHRGRVVDSPGDNILAEFASVVDAVESAVEIQKELKGKNSELPETKRMQFRIGINLGDVVEEGKRIYGDGVNIAARIEGLSEGGGICISGTAFDQIGKKLPLGYEYRGEQTVKNIEKPIRVYKVLMEPENAGKVIGEERPRPKQWRWAGIGAVAILIIVAGIFAVWNFYLRPDVEPASVEKMAFPLPDKPSIAVLPFDNLSVDLGHVFLPDAITENIISSLSTVPELFVIARNSSFIYKGKPVKVQKVAEDLGVRYVLEGSVQISGDSLRINAQLIDALKGHHLWSQRYDRKLKNIFVLQDDIALEIVAALRVKLTAGERARLAARGTENLEAYLKLLQASESFFTVTREGNALARRLSEEVIALDPKFAGAYALLGGTYFMDVPLGLSKSIKESYKQAFQLTKKAIHLDESFATAYPLLGWLYVIMWRQYDRGIAECEKAIALSPNLDVGYIWKGFILAYAGRPAEAVRFCEQALRLNPIPPGWFFRALGVAYAGAGNYEEAIAAFKKSLQRAPNDILTHADLAVTYSWASRPEDARAQVVEVLRINPKFSIKELAKWVLYKRRADRERYLDGLRKAGLPETPPLPLPDKPSIAVLPFTNMSEDPKQEYFSDGITEEIITALSKTPKLFVIARNSTFTYKNKPTKVQEVGRELGVKYVLEGSVRKAEDKVRITAQLVDAQSGSHIWAERYDRDLKDIFALQDEITMKIITALRVQLTDGEQARITAKGTKNLDAYLLCLQGAEQLGRWNKDCLIRGRKMVEKAIALDPKYAKAHCLLAWSYWFEVPLVLTKNPRQSIARAMELAQKALALDKSLAYAHSLMGYMYILQKQYDEGVAECEQAVSLEPNSARAHYFLGLVLKYAGRHKEAITVSKEAVRLNPIPPSHYYIGLINLYCLTGQYEEAITAGKQAIQIGPNNLIAHAFLATAYSLHGREEEAHIEAGEVLRINPKFSVEQWTKTMPYKNKVDRELIINALRKAGLK
jgi:adenylate cyclase